MDVTHPIESVVFVVGANAEIIGFRMFNTSGLLSLRIVFLVEGLEVNLLSVSQIMDEHDLIIFDQLKCLKPDGKGRNIVKGERIKYHAFVFLQRKNFLRRYTFNQWCMRIPWIFETYGCVT